MSDVRKWYIGVYGGEAQARTCSPHPNEVIRDCEGDTFVLSRDYMAREAELKEGIAKHWQVICDQRAKIDALQQRLTAADERADAGIAFVIRLIQCSEGQPSIATGYLRDILDVLKQTEGILTPTTCTWKFGAFSWHTACGQEWMLNDGTPEQNGIRFCHSCGNALVAEEPEDA